jgi:Ca2+-transporting ATPase
MTTSASAVPGSAAASSAVPAAPPAAWHTLTAAQAAAAAGVDSAVGLSEAEARKRLEAHGRNDLPEPPRPGRLRMFLSQFRSLVIGLLIAAGLVSGAMGEWIDAIVILAIVLLNGVMGYLQEYHAEQSIASLRKMTAPMAKVRRDGKIRNLSAAELAPGDVIQFEAGDLVPADARLISASGLRCLESALTGESEAVAKSADALSAPDAPLGDRENLIFMGTSVAVGEGEAVVVGTGPATELGRIAGLLESAGEDSATPLQKRMDALGKSLVFLCLGLVAALFGLGLWRGREPFEQFLTAVGLAVAAAPEGLPAVVTVALALGVQRMARRKALVRRLPSVETMGSATVICTDKTGTLTAGEMTVRELYVDGGIFSVAGGALEPVGAVLRDGAAPDGDQSEQVRFLAAVHAATATANLYQEGDAWKVAGDPTEGALLAAGRKAGFNAETHSHGERLHAFPFDSDRKRASVVHVGGKDAGGQGRARLSVNGAPDLLIALCTQVHDRNGPRDFLPGEREAVLAANAAMAAKGLRVIGSGYRFLETPLPADASGTPDMQAAERDLVFTGLAGMQDPPRPEARVAVAECKEAGIRVVMITGDHPATASAIARDLGISGEGAEVLTGPGLDALSQPDLESKVERIRVYARVSAAHKLRIVQAWKTRGAVVAMTGDGVNDAPALKGADIGVAMGRTGTEVAKQASDMVLADDNFATLVAAVEEGRGIYQNIRNTLQFLLAGNAGELLVMTVAIVVGWDSPLLAIHLLWINLLTDGLPALCLASEPIDRDVMKRPPRDQRALLSDWGFLFPLLLTGLLTATVTLIAFRMGSAVSGTEGGRSLAFTTLVLAELFRSFGARSETRPIWRMDWTANLKLVSVVGASIALQFVIHQIPVLERILKVRPLAFAEAMTVVGLALVPLLVTESAKAIRMARKPARLREGETA